MPNFGIRDFRFLVKTTVAVKAGVNRRWFYDIRHAELFQVLVEI
jgi:hypothetical protein